MNCRDARQHWSLYHDSEGDAELHFQISEHLAVCADCAEWFGQQSRLESLIAEKLSSAAPTRQLWDDVLAGAGLRQPARSRPWSWLAGLAACAAIVVLAVSLFRFEKSSDLAQLAEEQHQQLASGQSPVELASQSDLEVESYLRKRVSFPVRCPPRKDSGFAVQGAGVCKMSNQSAAYLTGHVGDSPVSIFILDREGLRDFPDQRHDVQERQADRRQDGQYAMVIGVVDRNAVVVVGQTEPGRLERVLNAYGTYPDHP